MTTGVIMPALTKPVLAFDTALNGCVVAVLCTDGRTVTRVLQTEREQAAKLIPLIQQAMEEAECDYTDLGLVVTTVGPGSFTGLRIGLSTARSFGAALDIPVQGVNTLEAMAVTCGINEDVLVLLETKRADYYAQNFSKDGQSQGQPSCTNVQEILARADRIICGDATERLKREAGEQLKAVCHHESMLNPVLLAILGVQKFQDAGGVTQRPEPVYLRGADVSVSNKTQRKIKNFPFSD